MALSYERVVEAATAMLRIGQNPSASAVIERLGEGSKSTAVKHLREWRATLNDTGYHLPPEIPDALQSAVETFWDAAIQQASQAFDGEREESQAAIAERDQRIEAMQTEAKALSRDLTERTRECEKLQDERDALQSERDALQAALTEAETRLASETQANEEALAKRDADHAHALHAEQCAHEATRHRLEEKLDERDATIRADHERFQRSEDNWVMELDKTRGQIRAMTERLDSERDAWAAERQMLRREIDQKAARYAEVEAEKLRLDGVVDNLTERHGAEKAQWSEAIERSEQSAQAARAEADRLHGLLNGTLARLEAQAADNKKAPGEDPPSGSLSQAPG